MFDGSVHDTTVTEILVPADAAARDALLHRVQVLAAAAHPRLVPVAAAELRSDGLLEVRRAGGEAADLATVLAVRGALTPAEAAGVLVAVAQALGSLHGAGLAHGPVTARDVVLGPDGTPLLCPRLEPASSDAAGFADDVHALARLTDELVGRHDDEPATALRAVLAAALAPDPHVRPEAGTLAAWADDAVTPAPVRLPEPAALAVATLGRARPPVSGDGERVGDGRAARRRAFRGTSAVHRAHGVRRAQRTRRARAAGRMRPALRTVSVAGAVVACVVLLTGIVLQVRGLEGPSPVSVEAGPSTRASTASGGPETAATSTSAAAPDPTRDKSDPVGAAAELTRRRVDLLATPGTGTEALAAVSVAGSPAFTADAALVGRIAAEGTALAGVSVVVHGVEVVARPAADRVEVAVTSTIEAHEQRAADGSTTAVPASEPRTATLTLVWTSAGWRVEDVA